MIVNRVSVIRSWSIVRRVALTHLAGVAWLFRWALAGLRVLMSFNLMRCQGNVVQFVTAETIPLAETTITTSERVTFNAFNDR